MSVVYTYGDLPGYGLREVLGALGSDVYGASIDETTSETYSLTNGTVQFVFAGTGLTYATIDGHTYMVAGTIDSISVYDGGQLAGSMSGLGLDTTDLNLAFQAELSGTDISALEALFLTQDWTVYGSGQNEVLTKSQTTADGYQVTPSGDDTVYLADGNDFYASGHGDDTVYEEGGNDDLWGNEGKDRLYGGAGDDKLSGGLRRDKLWGGDGDDQLFGGYGNDVLRGNRDDDEIYGGIGKDRVFGGSGSDTIDGGVGDDFMRGGSGADEFHFRSGDGADVIDRIEIGQDTLHFQSGTLASLSETSDGTLVSYCGGDTVLVDGIFAITDGTETDLTDMFVFDLI